MVKGKLIHTQTCDVDTSPFTFIDDLPFGVFSLQVCQVHALEVIIELEIQLVAMVGPRAERHVTYLLVERETGYVHLRI